MFWKFYKGMQLCLKSRQNSWKLSAMDLMFIRVVGLHLASLLKTVFFASWYFTKRLARLWEHLLLE